MGSLSRPTALLPTVVKLSLLTHPLPPIISARSLLSTIQPIQPAAAAAAIFSRIVAAAVIRNPSVDRPSSSLSLVPSSLRTILVTFRGVLEE